MTYWLELRDTTYFHRVEGEKTNSHRMQTLQFHNEVIPMRFT